MKLLAKHKEKWEKKTVGRPEVSLVLRNHWNQPQTAHNADSLSSSISAPLCADFILAHCYTDFPRMEGNMDMTSQKQLIL